MQQAVQPHRGNTVSGSTSSDAGALSMGERVTYVGAGLALAAAAMRPRPNKFLTLGALAIGSFLAWRGAEGSCPLKAQLKDAGVL